MLITNPNYSLLQMYVDEFNKQLLDNKKFECKYKCYDKNNDYYTSFVMFDLKTDIKIPSQIISGQISYDGYLIFDYHKTTNEIYVKEVPSIKYKNGNIAVLTSDIIKIIIEQVRKNTDEEITIRFDKRIPLIAIDEDAVKLIPSIQNTKQYILLQKIIDIIHKEENDIIEKTKRYKEKRDNADRKIEIAASKKRNIYGIDPNEYQDPGEFRKIVNEKLIEIWRKKISNISRHLQANEKKYKDIIKKCYDWEHIEGDYHAPYTDEEIETELQVLLEKDLEPDGILSVISEVKNQLLYSRRSGDDGHAYYANNEDTFYLLLEDRLDVIYTGYFNEHIQMLHTPMNGYTHQNKRDYSNDFKAMIDLLIQIDKLRYQLDFYQKLIENPNDAIINFSNNFYKWGALNQLPFWFRIDWNIHERNRSLHRENLLMIHPGVKKINFNDMQVFARIHTLAKNKTEEISLLQDIKDNKENYYNCDQLTITIPSSLDINSIQQIINFSRVYGKSHVYIICEDTDSYVYIKKILFLEAISALKNNTNMPSLNYNICIFPNYYNYFLSTTPSNGAVYYEYASHLPKGCFAINLKEQFMTAFQFVNEYLNCDLYILEEILLGDYNSDEKEYMDILRNFLMDQTKDFDGKRKILNLNHNELFDELYKSGNDLLLPF